MPSSALSRAAARVVESGDDGTYLDDQVWARLEALPGACHELRVSRWWTRIDFLDGKLEGTPRGTESSHGSAGR